MLVAIYRSSPQPLNFTLAPDGRVFFNPLPKRTSSLFVIPLMAWCVMRSSALVAAAISVISSTMDLLRQDCATASIRQPLFLKMKQRSQKKRKGSRGIILVLLEKIFRCVMFSIIFCFKMILVLIERIYGNCWRFFIIMRELALT